MIALDRSSGLLGIARGQRGEDGVEGSERVGMEVVGGVEECVRGDLGFEGWREGVFVSHFAVYLRGSGWSSVRAT